MIDPNCFIMSLDMWILFCTGINCVKWDIMHSPFFPSLEVCMLLDIRLVQHNIHLFVEYSNDIDALVFCCLQVQPVIKVCYYDD